MSVVAGRQHFLEDAVKDFSDPTSMTYTAFPNTFRRNILAGKRLIGCWSSLANPITTEILGLAGFDWLLLDAEHAPNDVLTLIPQLMVLKESPSAPVVRPPVNDPVTIKRLLDAGFYNFLIPGFKHWELALCTLTIFPG